MLADRVGAGGLRSGRLLAAALIGISVAWGDVGAAGEIVAAPMDARPITSFLPGSGDTRFGAFEFLGGLELSSSERLFGAWSSIRLTDDGRKFIGVLDTGHWLTGSIKRDPSGRLAGLDDVTIAPMLDAAGRSSAPKRTVDAESLALRGDEAFVGFEQVHRVTGYSPLSTIETARPFLRALPLPFPAGRLRGNGGIETLAVASQDGPLKGGLVAIAEKSVDSDGNLFAGILDGPLKGGFRVVPHDGFDVTDGDFLPDGDMLLLERRFTIATGVAMRLRRIEAASLKPGAVVDGEIILEANGSAEIDNMEGLDTFVAADGSTHVILVSDDNHSILQRTVMLEFRLVD
ncbi:esterase-like activity of phytase family protein [Rhizobium cremeum]|uniref:esterase-like activity of phytase family protein n=1 Tax=Rhizobium cremeum TaxID=2813827 RepID=UPI0039E1A290